MLIWDKTINHKISAKEYKTRHDWVGKVIHRELLKKFKLHHANKSYFHNPESLLENETNNFLKDFEIQTNHLISDRWPDRVIVNNKKKKKKRKRKKKKEKRSHQIADFAVPYWVIILNWGLKAAKAAERIWKEEGNEKWSDRTAPHCLSSFKFSNLSIEINVIRLLKYSRREEYYSSLRNRKLISFQSYDFLYSFNAP